MAGVGDRDGHCDDYRSAGREGILFLRMHHGASSVVLQRDYRRLPASIDERRRILRYDLGRASQPARVLCPDAEAPLHSRDALHRLESLGGNAASGFVPHSEACSSGRCAVSTPRSAARWPRLDALARSPRSANPVRAWECRRRRPKGLSAQTRERLARGMGPCAATVLRPAHQPTVGTATPVRYRRFVTSRFRWTTRAASAPVRRRSHAGTAARRPRKCRRWRPEPRSRTRPALPAW